MTGLLTGEVARAHNPYEITATASVFSNRVEIATVFEYRAARLLAGRGWATNQVDEAAEFDDLRPVLENVAKTFFQLSADGKKFSATATTAALGVENHVTLTVTFPAPATPALTFAAPGLAPLLPEGQYGVGLTVLDMVHKKVLGQHVFTGTGPETAASFGPPSEEKISLPAIATGAVKAEASGNSPAPEKEKATKPRAHWPWFIAAAIGLVYAFYWQRRR